MADRRRVAYVIGFSAPPVLHLDEFLRLLREQNWDTYAILSPTAATWVDIAHLEDVSRHPVRVAARTPDQVDLLPMADVVLAAPLTFNSLNKWASGISDTLALGLLNEALGLGLPITVALSIKSSLQQHPAYRTSLDRLDRDNVTILASEALARPKFGTAADLDWRAALPRL